MTVSFDIDRLGAGEHDAVALVDRSCGRCRACLAGTSLWCVAPATTGRPAFTPVRAVVAAELRSAVLAAAALLEAPAASTVVVAAAPGSPRHLLASAVTDARVLAAVDLADPVLRETVAGLEASGRARVVLTGADVRSAVRSVRRGGHVCVPEVTGGSTPPSVTELVQREVTLVGPRRIDDVLARITPADWAAAVAAA